MKAPKTQSTWVLMTPEKARALLSHNYVGNRPVNNGTVDKYARQMARGHWRLTGDGISIAEDGSLINGQHRLLAVIKANIPIMLHVMTGVPIEAFEVTDDNRVRTAGQLMQRPDLYVAIARAMIGTIGQSTHRIKLFDVSDLNEYINTHLQAIEWIAARRPKGVKKRYFPSAVCAVFARAYYHTSVERLEEAVFLLAEGIPPSGAMVDKSDYAIIRLREMIARNGVTSDRAQLYAKANRALRAFVDRQTLATLYEASSELLPVPGEAVDGRAE